MLSSGMCGRRVLDLRCKSRIICGMKLSDWYAHTGESLAALARRVGCDVSLLPKIARGERRPGYDLACRLISATEGRINLEDLGLGELAKLICGCKDAK